jgi:agmatinase
MTSVPGATGLPHTFGGLEGEHADLKDRASGDLPVPYDFSTSYQGGTRWGPQAILAASQNMELWDDELGSTYQAGIHTLPSLEPTALGPEAWRSVWRRRALDPRSGEAPRDLGGEHSITAGAVARGARQVPEALGAPDRCARRHARRIPRLEVQPRVHHAPAARARAGGVGRHPLDERGRKRSS